jgi:hypothetical protein
MPILLRDYETRSQLLLNKVGAWKYSRDASTDVWCCAYAVDDGAIQLWVPGDPIPPEFIEAASNPSWIAAAFGDAFERTIECNIMGPKYGFPEIPIERHRCLQAAALSLALPASLAAVADALSLAHKKDQAGRRLMLQMARPRKPRPDEEDGKIYWHDDPARRKELYAYAEQDIITERALYHRIGFLPAEEQAHWLLDAAINDRGICIDRALLSAALKIAEAAKIEINAELAKVTEGSVATVNQTGKILAWLTANGLPLDDLQKATLEKIVLDKALPALARRVIELRLDGAHAAVLKLHTLAAWMDNADDRIRGCFRFHGASPGRFTSIGIQVQNMKRAGKDIAAAIKAVSSGDLATLRARFPRPMSALGAVLRAMVIAAPGKRLMIADLSGIESRMTAWVAGEQSKLNQWRNYDRTGDANLEPYYITGHKIFGLPKDQARDSGKTGDLAFGYMGGVGAWSKLAPAGDNSTETEIRRLQQRWRRAHPNIERLWHALNRAAIGAMRHPGKIIKCRAIALRYCKDGFLRLKLPNGRKLAYPFPKLKATGRGDIAVVFMDNVKGRWCPNRNGQGAYGGTWCENIIQAAARDLFIEGMGRLARAGYPIVLHAHDEVVAEVPEDFGTIDEFLQLFTEVPLWANGLPIAAKARIGKRWCKVVAKTEAAPIEDEPTPEGLTEADDGDSDPTKVSTISAPVMAAGVGIVPQASRGPILIRPPQQVSRGSLIDVIGEPLVDGKLCCPFHDDSTPSLHIYPDHFFCYGCHARGDAIDWLMITEGLDRDAAVRMLEQGDENRSPRPISLAARTKADAEAKRRRAKQLWRQAWPITGTLAERYLTERRGIDLAALPNAATSLRFHPRCTFGQGVQHPCLIALRRDAITDAPVSIHRIALTKDAEKIGRRMLGSGGIVKHFPAGESLVVGEGIETTLSAATRIKRWGKLLQPAWAAVTSGMLAALPLIPCVERLVILVDNDINGAGQAAALRCAETWSKAGKSVVRLTPKRTGADFNDLIRELAP